MKIMRTVAVLPTLFTLGNLVCGFFAIVVAARIEKPTSVDIPKSAEKIGMASPMRIFRDLRADDPNHNVMLSGWLIFLAMIFDALDGHVARLSKVSSDFGAQLDSLSDLVTFGVAPAFLLVKMCPSFTFSHQYWVWVIAASYACCAALRLARFNVESSDDDDHLNFSGLPSPAAAASVASFAIIFYSLRLTDNPLRFAATIDSWLQTLLPFFAVLVALLMVSRVPYPHVVNQFFRGQRSFGHIVALVFAGVAVMLKPDFSVPLLCAGFVVWGPAQYFWQEVVQHQRHEEPLF
jgi:CDP-diacylglycerol--serine O-phosphatidyltransferase